MGKGASESWVNLGLYCIALVLNGVVLVSFSFTFASIRQPLFFCMQKL